MSSTANEDDDRKNVYALLTKWTLGESVGGARQNFFRLLAEDELPDPDVAEVVNSGPSAKIFVKLFDPGGAGLRVEAFLSAPGVEDARTLLPLLLGAVGRRRPLPASEAWCLVCEGSPCDWADGQPPGGFQGDIVNSRGPLVNGDIVVLCPRGSLSDLAALYRGRYAARVADFVALWRREAQQPGSVEFAALCQVMDRLNVDVWRLERLAAAGGPARPRPLLGLMQMLPGLHPQFFCDACGARELRGPRFNCLACSDFDLCAACHGAAATAGAGESKDHNGRCHDRTHQMVEMRPALPPDCLGPAS